MVLGKRTRSVPRQYLFLKRSSFSASLPPTSLPFLNDPTAMVSIQPRNTTVNTPGNQGARHRQSEEFLERGLKVKEYELRRRNFLDTTFISSWAGLACTLRRDGSKKRALVGLTRKVRKEDTQSWFKMRFDGIILV